jgi:phosphoadenosine phosphosulfate reductase
MEGEHGVNLFYRAIDLRKLCCNVRKVEPLGRALEDLDAWMTGLRRDQTAVRATVGKVEWDAAHNLVKINPLADWTDEEVWDYIKANGVPYHPLYDQGYKTIGCAPCTRALAPGEDARAHKRLLRLRVRRPGNRNCFAGIADLEPGEAAYGDVLAQLADLGGDEL